MKKTIEDLTVTKTFYHRDRDAFGNRTKEPYEQAIKREIQLVTGWQRFGHYIIDALIIGALLFCVDLVLLQTFNSGYSFSYSLGFKVNGYAYNFIPTIDSIIVTVAYYFICEMTMQRTIGKFATNSVVINKYAEPLDAGSLIGRSFARLVPFETLSCLSDRGWHDKWSNSYVVKTTERDDLKRLLNAQEGIFISDNEDLLD